MSEGVGSRYMDPQLVIKNRRSPKKGPARFPDGRSSGVGGRRRICLRVAQREGKEGTGDLRIVSLNSPVSRSSGSL